MTDMAKSKNPGKAASQVKVPRAKGKGSKAEAAEAAKSQTERVAVVVLSMHRTGSSALSRVLSLLGCDLPKTLLGENGSNQAGHWESTEVRDLNDDLLASAGSDWQDWQVFNPNWYETVRPLEFRLRAAGVLSQEFGESRLFVFKDPRVCRIFPFWRDAFADEGIEPKVILTLRHPHEVAASLEQRDRMSRQQGLLLWLRHVLEAEAASRGLTRATVQYDAMLVKPMSVVTELQDRLGLYWPRLSDQTADEIRGFMTPSLRHHVVAAQQGGADPLGFETWLDQVYDVFLRWSQYGENPDDYETLDQVRSKLDDLSEPLREVVEILSAQSRELAQKIAEVAALTGERQTLGNDLNSLKEQKEALRADLEQARSCLGAAEQETARLTAELGQRDEEIANAKADAHNLRSALEQRSHEAEETAKELQAEREQRRQQAEEAAKELQAEREQRRQQALKAEQDRNEHERALTHLRDTVAERDTKMATQAGELAQMARMILEKEEALKRRNAAAHEADQEAAALRDELENRSRVLAEAEAHRQALLDSTSWRVTAPLRRLILMLRRRG